MNPDLWNSEIYTRLHVARLISTHQPMLRITEGIVSTITWVRSIHVTQRYTTKDNTRPG